MKGTSNVVQESSSSRVFEAAAITIQKWSRCIAAKRHHFEKVQAVKSITTESFTADSNQVLQLVLFVAACLALLRIDILFSRSFVATSIPFVKMEMVSNNNTIATMTPYSQESSSQVMRIPEPTNVTLDTVLVKKQVRNSVLLNAVNVSSVPKNTTQHVLWEPTSALVSNNITVLDVSPPTILNATVATNNSTLPVITKKVTKVTETVTHVAAPLVANTTNSIKETSTNNNSTSTRQSPEFWAELLPYLTNDFAGRPMQPFQVFMDCVEGLSNDYSGLLGCMH